MRTRMATMALAALLILAGGCGEGGDSSVDRTTASQVADRGAAQPRTAYSPKPYKPASAEGYPNGKRLAARMAQRALTYEPGASSLDVARSLPKATVSEAKLADALKPAIDPERRSVGEILYPQLSGVTATSLGTMVIARQVLENADGERESVIRVLDVRLRRSGAAWALDRIASVGGSPIAAPSSLPEPAERVLDNPNIRLSDSARWDIYRGSIDASLLEALARAAERYELSVGILRSGHPANVWATNRPSAHSLGLAADIYAVDGRLVVGQDRAGSPAYELAQELFAGGAYQLGSPWVFGADPARSFTDEVHADHIHLQQSPPS